MILTKCAQCAAPLETKCFRCGVCKLRYCGRDCQKRHWKTHKPFCQEIKRGGGAEQYNADKKYKEAVADAVEECADDTKGQTCYICTQALHWKTKEGLVRGCSCRGTAGFAHVSCLAEQAKILYDEVEENNLDIKVRQARWVRWCTCSLCEQDYHGVVACALGWACWTTYVGRPEADKARRLAMSVLGNGLSDAGHHEDALPVGEAALAMKRRLGVTDQSMLVTQGNLAITYHMLDRPEEANRMLRDIYSGWASLQGEEHENTFIAADNYALSLLGLRRFEEAKSLMRKTLPVARRVLGESHDLTIRVVRSYARALYEDGDATLDDLREAVATLAETERTARRVLGGAHPVTEEIEDDFQNARAALRAREGAVESLSEAVAEMMPGDEKDELLAPTA